MKASFNAARRAGRSDYYERKAARDNAEPEPTPPDPIDELAHICEELIDAMSLVAKEIPTMQRRLESTRTRIHELLYRG